MPERPAAAADRGLKSFWITLVGLNALLIIAGVVYARLKSVPAEWAVPIVAAFLIQASVYLVPGFPEARRAVEARFRPSRLAAVLIAVCLTPYLIYSLPLGLFSFASLAKLALVCGFASFLYVVKPVREPEKLAWQDVVLLCLLVSPIISGLTTLFRDIYPGPGDPVERLDILGKLMVIPLGATSLLSLRGLPGEDFRFRLSLEDLRIGGKYYLYYLPIGIPIALLTGFATFDPKPFDGPVYLLELIGLAAGIYMATALPEELCFRGVLQRLIHGRIGRMYVSQGVAAILFGAVHLSSRGFPNYSFAVSAAVAGWFYGAAWRAGGGVVPAAVAHTLVVVTWRFLFR